MKQCSTCERIPCVAAAAAAPYILAVIMFAFKDTLFAFATMFDSFVAVGMVGVNWVKSAG